MWIKNAFKMIRSHSSVKKPKKSQKTNVYVFEFHFKKDK